jgi:hypothetical protein
MLSQDDFRNLLSDPTAVRGAGDKVRFDLKQVSAWDRQNKQSGPFIRPDMHMKISVDITTRIFFCREVCKEEEVWTSRAGRNSGGRW